MDVFEYVIRHENEAKWQLGELEMANLSGGRVSVGTRYRKVRGTGMGKFAFTLEVTRLDPGALVVEDRVGDTGVAGTAGTWTVRGDRGGSRLTHVARFRVSGLLRLLAGSIQKQTTRDLDAEFANLKRVLESDGTRDEDAPARLDYPDASYARRIHATSSLSTSLAWTR